MVPHYYRHVPRTPSPKTGATCFDMTSLCVISKCITLSSWLTQAHAPDQNPPIFWSKPASSFGLSSITTGADVHLRYPQHFLNFFPLPQGQVWLRPTGVTFETVLFLWVLLWLILFNRSSRIVCASSLNLFTECSKNCFQPLHSLLRLRAGWLPYMRCFRQSPLQSVRKSQVLQNLFQLDFWEPNDW